MQTGTERYHALDFLRAAAMFLGILLHGALSFTEPITPFWPVHDVERSAGTTILVLVVHDFRMQIFFVLAGLFGCLLYQRYRLVGMLRHRTRRIVIPFAAGMITLIPILQVIWLCGDRDALRFVGFEVPDETVSGAELVRQEFASGQFLGRLAPLHLWFLYFLIWFYLFMIPLSLLGARVQSSRLVRGLEGGFRRLIQSRWSGCLAALLMLPLLWPMSRLFPDTNGGWLPAWHLLAYYFLFFLFGWMLYRHRDLLPAYVGRWRSRLLVGNTLVLGAMLIFVGAGLEVLEGRPNPLPLDFPWIKVLALMFGSLYTWVMISGLMGVFLHYFGRERAWVRYLADASYWCYIASLIPIILMQMLVADWAIPLSLKFIVVNGLSIALLLASYEWCVRYTAIGTLLNGPRDRKPARRTFPVRAEV